MADKDIDRIDQGILRLLQGDARNVTTADIGEQLGVAGSTVATRISRLESDGIITGYHPTVDFEALGYDNHVQITATIRREDTEAAFDAVADIHGVVCQKELLADEDDLVVDVLARSQDVLEERADQLTDVGIDISETEVVENAVLRPGAIFQQSADE